MTTRLMFADECIRSTSKSKSNKFKQEFETEFTYMGLPLCVSGLFLWKQQDKFRSMRHHFVPRFNCFLDDYSQYSPLAITAALKAIGVESRSSWGQLGVNTAFSAALMASVVNGMKYTIKEKRPDGSSRNSFPSGHTATAFMCATIMHKEYGGTSAWYSIGAYSIATGTGLFRILNNRHWVNDVVFGAGIGVMSAELGYVLGDLTLGRSTKDGFSTITDVHSRKPSFVHFGMSVGKGFNLSCPQIYDVYDDTQTSNKLIPSTLSTPLNLKLKMGAITSVKFEGAYFFTNYIGLGGSLRFSVCPISADYNKRFRPYVIKIQDQLIKPSALLGIDSDNLGIIGLNIGPYVSFPVSKRLLLGMNVKAGPTFTTDFSLDSYTIIKPQFYSFLDEVVHAGIIDKKEYDVLKSGIRYSEFLKIGKSGSFGTSSGFSFSYLLKEHTALRIYADYYASFPTLKYRFSNRVNLNRSDENSKEVFICDMMKKKTLMSVFSCGASLAVVF